jgi:hypothetical protein
MSGEQRLLDLALAHIRKTQEKSTEGEFCTYGGAGCLFSVAIKKKWRDFLDTTDFSASLVIRSYPEALYKWAQNLDPNFAEALQACHDNALAVKGPEFVCEVEDAVFHVAKRFDLRFPEPEE